MNAVIPAAGLGKPITIYGDGKQVRDVLFVDDLVDAYEIFIDRAPGLKGSVLNTGGGPRFTRSLLELLGILEKEFDRKISISYADWRLADQRVYVSGIQKAREPLRWEPKVGPEVGEGRILAWIKAQSFATT